MKLGDAFTMAVPPNYDNPHLYFVISDPTENSGTYHIVNITTDVIRAGKECVLTIDNHPWIRKESYVSFGDAMEISGKTVGMIDALIGTKVVMQTAAREETIANIVAAAKLSKAIPVAYKKFLK